VTLILLSGGKNVENAPFFYFSKLKVAQSYTAEQHFPVCCPYVNPEELQLNWWSYSGLLPRGQFGHSKRNFSRAGAEAQHEGMW